MSNLISIIDNYYIDYVGHISEQEWKKLKTNPKNVEVEITGDFNSINIYGFITSDGYNELNIKYDNTNDLIKFLEAQKKSTQPILYQETIKRIVDKLNLFEAYI